MSLLDAALRYAADGIAVFPCQEGAKEPACANGFKDATTDPERIRELWADNPDYNIGTCPETWGAAVVDLDVKKADGFGAWAKITAEHGWTSDTFTTETPSGGRHLFYLGSLPNSAGKLAPGIDTRGRGGYVLLPPSIVAGKPYRVVRNHDLAELPGGLEAALATSAVAVRAVARELDTGASVDRARSLLADLVRRGDVAVEFQGGNNRTYQLACELLNLGLSPALAGELLEEIWNPACRPPWASDDLQTIVAHAADYAQNDPGAWAVTTAAEAFPDAAKLAVGEPRKNRFLTVAQMAALPDPVWLIKDVLMEASTCLLVGAWKSYKSFLALDLALALATGTQTAFGVIPARRAPVIYACLEGMVGIAKGRRQAWCIGHGLETDASMPFFLGPAPLIKDDGDCQAFIEDIRAVCGEQPPALTVLDTTSQMMAGLDETRDASLFIRFANELARALPTCVLALHHFGHDRGKGARGGTVYPAGFDTYLEGEAKGDRRVEVWVRKQKDAEERSAPFTMQGRKVGPALVFYPVDAREHNDAVAARDPFSWQSIGAALHALNAHGREHGVSSLVLAQQIFPRIENEGTGAYAARVAKQAKALSAFSRNRLRAYCEEGEHGKLWFLPASQP